MRERDETEKFLVDHHSTHDAQGHHPVPSGHELLSLDTSVTNHEARPYLVQSCEDMRSPGFDEYLYTDAEDFGALRLHG